LSQVLLSSVQLQQSNPMPFHLSYWNQEYDVLLKFPCLLFLVIRSPMTDCAGATICVVSTLHDCAVIVTLPHMRRLQWTFLGVTLYRMISKHC
jgi:hypothetical protein